ncbi:hypothetical protein V6N13_053419 [Hibiscus sabdariffa]|uniref:Uncharacterized protein n=1 Tax=Hibiscus sabdariffa TaxID=183260 RepID=A0ABR2T7M2_9ROSI
MENKLMVGVKVIVVNGGSNDMQRCHKYNAVLHTLLDYGTLTHSCLLPRCSYRQRLRYHHTVTTHEGSCANVLKTMPLLLGLFPTKPSNFPDCVESESRFPLISPSTARGT